MEVLDSFAINDNDDLKQKTMDNKEVGIQWNVKNSIRRRTCIKSTEKFQGTTLDNVSNDRLVMVFAVTVQTRGNGQA